MKNKTDQRELTNFEKIQKFCINYILQTLAPNGFKEHKVYGKVVQMEVLTLARISQVTTFVSGRLDWYKTQVLDAIQLRMQAHTGRLSIIQAELFSMSWYEKITKYKYRRELRAEWARLGYEICLLNDLQNTIVGISLPLTPHVAPGDEVDSKMLINS